MSTASMGDVARLTRVDTNLQEQITSLQQDRDELRQQVETLARSIGTLARSNRLHYGSNLHGAGPTFEGYPVSVLRAQPGDVVVVKVDGRATTRQEADYVRERVSAALPDGVEVAVIPTAEIEVVRPVADTGERCG